jgi:hypothetical protein
MCSASRPFQHSRPKVSTDGVFSHLRLHFTMKIVQFAHLSRYGAIQAFNASYRRLEATILFYLISL